MLEHADRDDPVESAGERAIVDQLELHAIGDAGLVGAAARDLELFLAERDAEHVDVGDAIQVERHAAPAAADVENRADRA